MDDDASDLDSGDFYSDCDDEDPPLDDGAFDEIDGSASRGSFIQVITKESLLTAQMQDMRRVMDILSVAEHHARALLIHHRWSVDRLFEVLGDRGRDRLFLEAGITVTSKKGRLFFRMTCNICFEDVGYKYSTTMDCGHCFCNDCWTEYFIVNIEQRQSRHIRCMEHGCNELCNEDFVRRLVASKNSKIADRFERFLLESYIEDNNKVKWCPSIPHCGNAVLFDGEDVCCEVECTCGKQFCFDCLQEAHAPCSCMMWKCWTQKCNDGSETVNWIAVHTKPCPKCKKSVEKNGGCNLVSCICGQCFCWLCGGATGRDHTYTSIAGHSCGRFAEDNVKKIENAKYELKRFLHYHSRYKLHMDSYKLESKLKERIKVKISNCESNGSNIKDYHWGLNGLSRLSRSRHVLSNSYVFAFYMFGNEIFKGQLSKEQKIIKKNLFEDQQQQLEGNIERLSKILEEPFDKFPDEKLWETRSSVINLSVIVDNLCLKMFQFIKEDLLGSLVNMVHIAPYKIHKSLGL